MPVQHWVEKLTAQKFAEILQQIESGAERIVLTGITPSAKPAFLAALHRLLKKPLLYVGRDGINYDSLLSATAFYHATISGRDDKSLSVFPAMEPDAFSGLSPHVEILEERALTFWRLIQAKLDIHFCPLSAALNRIPDLHHTFASVPRLTIGVEYSPESR
jgi:transcription-repair coupling factor (superfamily II helicase)